MDNADMAKLFFPGTRTENLLQGISLLQTSEGEKRIKLELDMDFSGGKVAGMSTYLADSYEHIVKPDSVEKLIKLELEFDAMTMRVYTTEDIDKPAQILFNVKMSGFGWVRQGEEVVLKYVAKVPSNPKLWSWLHDYHHGTMFVKFEPTQSDISDVKAVNPDKQMTLGGDDYEAARKDATSKERDAEFARA